MTIANGMCISFCNQPGTLFGYLTTVTPVCRCLQPYILRLGAFGYVKRV